jgi:bifunctional DNase/RNase
VFLCIFNFIVSGVIMLVQVEVTSFAIDPNRNSPVLILKEVSGSRTLPVPIGPLEASTIAMESLKVSPEKPLSIDLVKIMIDQLGGTLNRSVIYDQVDQTFFAHLQISTGNSVISIDCRPCDAIALALRCKRPLYVKDCVFDKQLGKAVSEKEMIRKNISSIDTTEFGRYILE